MLVELQALIGVSLVVRKVLSFSKKISLKFVEESSSKETLKK